MTKKSLDLNFLIDSVSLTNEQSRRLYTLIKADEKLRQSHERYEMATKATKDAIYDYDIGEGIIVWDEGYESLFGHTRSAEESLIETWIAHLHMDDREKIADSLYKAMTERRANWHAEYRYQCADTSFKYIFDRRFILYDKKHNPIRMIGTMMDVTDRKRSEQLLREGEYRYRSIVDNMNDGLIHIDTKNRVIYANNRFCAIVGYTRKELWGKDFQDTFLFDKEIFKSISLGMDGMHHEAEIKHKNGKRISALISLTSLVNEDGKIIGASAIITDITEQKQAKAAKESTERLYQQLFDLSPMPMMVIGADMRVIHVNHAAVEHYGYSLDTFRQLVLDDIKPQEEIALQYEIRDRLVDEGAVTYYTYHRKSSGELMEVKASVSNIIYEGERAYLSIIEDVTERRKLERDRDRLADIVEGTTDMVAFTSTDGVNLYMNKAGRLMTGYLTDEETLVHISKFHPEHVFKVIGEEALPAAVNEGYWMGESVVLTKEGRELPVSQIVLAHKGEEGQVEFFSTIIRDITEQKEAEAVLTGKNEELQKINAELDRFVYSASHELRAPLTSVLGLVNLAKDESKEPEFQDYLDKIDKSIRRLDSFIKDIIDYSRNSRLENNPEPIHFEKLVQSTVGNLQYMEDAGQIRYMHDIQENDLFYSDNMRIQMLLSNLISNAIKYYDRNQPEPYIHIKIQSTQKEAVISIQDNGIGIPPHLHQRIFDMFYRGSDLSSGTGLGLYIVKEVVKKLGGVISVESAPGRGTHFTVKLPNQALSAL